MRIAHYVRHVLTKLTLPSPWCIEAAATLSQLGCITLESDLMRRAFSGAKLSADEQAGFDAHPLAAMELLKNIPRLEPASWMIGQQLKRDIPAAESEFPGFSAADLLLGAKILKLAVAYEQVREKFPAKDAARCASVSAAMSSRPACSMLCWICSRTAARRNCLKYRQPD